jgi:hypothetical protein
VATETTEGTTRRALLIGLAAGVAAVAIESATDPAGAADNDKVVLGTENTADNPTVIRAGAVALKGISSTDDGALVGENEASDGYGVRGTSPYIGVNAVGGEIGVYAVSDYGNGVQALTYDGVAVAASTAVDAGSALEVSGRARFSRSGKVTVPAGRFQVTIPVHNLDARSLVLATVQERRDGFYVLGAVADPAASSISIYVSRKSSRPATVAWFVVN